MLDSMMYRDLFSTQEMQEIWSDSSTVSAWLRIEQALAAVQEEKGLIPSGAARSLAAVTLEDINLDLLIEEMMLVGRPIVGFVNQLREYVGPENSASIHFGTTTQDIMDKATVLQMQNGLDDIFQVLRDIIAMLELLTEQHAETEMIGRTNGQYAKPITFGMKACSWGSELKRRVEAITEASKRGIQVQFGGSVGNLDGFDETTGQALRKTLADRLGLGSTDLSWQNTRDGLGDILLSLGQLCASLEKIAHNVNLLSSSDVGELYETPVKGKGASSSMAHKRNQRCSEFAEALGRLSRGRAMQICETTKHEHERSGGVWISEWVIIPEVFLLTSGSLKWTKSLFAALQVDKFRMIENLESANEQIDYRISHSQ